MGLGLAYQAKLAATAMENAGDPLTRIAAIARDYADSLGLSDFFAAHRQQGALNLELHPAAEWATFELLEGGTLRLEAKTSSVGPGYHRCVVDLLDRIAAQLELCWEPCEDGGDDTGYVTHRDFSRLQSEMAALLKQLAAIVCEHAAKGHANLALNMPLNFSVQGVDGVLTPGGVFAMPEFEDAARPDSETSPFAAKFFPWWDEDQTAAFWKNLGLTLMWCNVPWHVPNDEPEWNVCRNALQCFARAHALDPDIDLPGREIAELESFLAEDADWGKEAAPEGIGYRRLPWTRDISGGWFLTVPGCFYSRVENDEATEVFWLGGREIWCTTYTVEPAKPATRADLEKELRPDSLVVETAGFVGCANTVRKTDEHGADYMTMSCRFQAAGTFAVLTIVFDEPNLAWAEQVFRNVRFNAEPAEA